MSSGQAGLQPVEAELWRRIVATIREYEADAEEDERRADLLERAASEGDDDQDRDSDRRSALRCRGRAEGTRPLCLRLRALAGIDATSDLPAEPEIAGRRYCERHALFRCFRCPAECRAAGGDHPRLGMLRSRDEGFEQITCPDGRRGLWLRVSRDESGRFLSAEIAAGREGDDWEVGLLAGTVLTSAALRGVAECLDVARWAEEVAEDNRRYRAAEIQDCEWLSGPPAEVESSDGHR